MAESKLFEEVYNDPSSNADYNFGYSDPIPLSPENNPNTVMSDIIHDRLGKLLLGFPSLSKTEIHHFNK